MFSKLAAGFVVLQIALFSFWSNANIKYITKHLITKHAILKQIPVYATDRQLLCFLPNEGAKIEQNGPAKQLGTDLCLPVLVLFTAIRVT